MPVSVELELNAYNLGDGYFDLLVPGSFPGQFYRVGREVIKNRVDFILLFLHTEV